VRRIAFHYAAVVALTDLVALRYYTTSYNHLREVPKERDAPLEIKALADLTNFKVGCTHSELLARTRGTRT